MRSDPKPTAVKINRHYEKKLWRILLVHPELSDGLVLFNNKEIKFKSDALGFFLLCLSLKVNH